MILARISELGTHHTRTIVPYIMILTHSKTCPATPVKRCPATPVKRCPGRGGGGAIKKGPIPCPPPRKGARGKRGGDEGSPSLIRALHSGKCRLGFIPDEWFVFFNKKTGVSGPYFLLLGLANYAVSKEILVMEHEYYSGLSVLLVLYLITTKLGAQIGAILDKEVDAKHDSFQKGRDDDVKMFETTIKEAKLAQQRAEAQKQLMDAKKENITLQLEAVYRERVMMVYRAVRGRMEYHMRKTRAESRIQQRCLVAYVLKHVHQSITPEFRKQAFSSALNELSSIASKPKKG